MAKRAGSKGKATPHNPRGAGRKKKEVNLDIFKAALIRTGGFIGPAAEILNLSRATLFRRVQESQELQDIVTQERERNLDMAELKLMRNVERGNQKAIEYILDRLGRGRGYGHHSSLEIGESQKINLNIIRPSSNGKSKPKTQAK